MGKSKAAAWIGGAAVLGVLMLAASWLLLIGPRLESAATMRDEAMAEQTRIDQQAIVLEGLKRDFENIEEFRAELAVLREAIPVDVELAQFTRQLDTLATAAGVVVTSVQPAAPTTALMTAPAAVVDPAAPATTEGSDAPATDDGTAAEGDAAVVPAGPVATDYYVVQVEVGVVGGYDEGLSFLRRLQNESARLVVVGGVQATALEAAGAEAGRPAVADGALDMKLTLFVVVLPDAAAPVTGEAPVEEAPLPVPAGQPNPFAPMG